MLSEKVLCSDWNDPFSLLKRYKSGRKLLCRFEVLIFGIELTKVQYDDECYRPEFVALNLLASYPEFSVRKTLETKKQPQYEVSYKKHDKLLKEAVKLMKKQAPQILEQECPSIEDILSVYKNDLAFHQRNGSSPLSSWLSLIQIASYYDLKDLKKKETQEFLTYVDSLPPESLAIYGDFNTFVKKEINLSKKEFDERVDQNIAKAGLSKLPTLNY